MTLTKEKTAFAAEQHETVTQFLKERELGADEYYDTVIFAFLDCVIKDTKGDFKQRAYAAMDRAVAAVKAESEGNVISLFCNDDYYRIVAETLADERDGITELLERIQITELLGAFEQNEREVLTLLLDGFKLTEISFRLQKSLCELDSIMQNIRTKTAGILPAAA